MTTPSTQTPPTPPQDSGEKATPRLRYRLGFEPRVSSAWSDRNPDDIPLVDTAGPFISGSCVALVYDRSSGAQLVEKLNSYDAHRALIEKLARALKRIEARAADHPDDTLLDRSRHLSHVKSIAREALAAVEKAHG